MYLKLSISQYTPLMLATTNGRPEVVRVLLNHGSLATDRMDIMGENLNCLEAAIEKGKRCVCVCVCASLFVSFSVSVLLFLSPPLFLHLCFCLCLSVCVSVSLSDLRPYP